MDRLLDLSYLTELELEAITEVMMRDEAILQREEARIRRLKSKAAKTNNPIIHKKIKMRTGEWFWELTEKHTGLKRCNTATSTVRASLRVPRKKGVAPKYPQPPAIEISLSESVDSDYHSLQQIRQSTTSMEKSHDDHSYSSSSSGEYDQKGMRYESKSDKRKSDTAFSNGHATIVKEVETVKVDVTTWDDDSKSSDIAARVTKDKTSEVDKPHEDWQSSEEIGGFKLMGKSSNKPVQSKVDDPENPLDLDLTESGGSMHNHTNSQEQASPTEPPRIMVTGVSTEDKLNIASNEKDLARSFVKISRRRDSSSSESDESSSSDSNSDTSKTISKDVKANAPQPPHSDTSSESTKSTKVAKATVASISTIPEQDETILVDGEHKVEELSQAVNVLNSIDGSSKKDSSGSGGGDTLRRSNNNLSASKMRGSSWSVMSSAAALKGDFDISGSIKFSLSYSYKSGTLNINIGSCSDLAAAEKKKLSNPYVKTYLLPDKHSKRKTKAKKKTTNPVYNETLKYVIPESELHTRTLNVAVWHDKLGANVFLGEVNINMDTFDTSAPEKMKNYQLLAKDEGTLEMLDGYHGEVELALRMTTSKALAEEGQLEIVVKNVKHASPAKNDNSDVYIKCYLLPDKARTTKQKTPKVSGKGRFDFDHLFTYTNVHTGELEQRCIELTVWEQGRFGTKNILGGTRIGSGTGMSYDKPVFWMDSTMEEGGFWRRMVRHPGQWVEAILQLRPLDPAK